MLLCPIQFQQQKWDLKLGGDMKMAMMSWRENLVKEGRRSWDENVRERKLGCNVAVISIRL
jgi:hypothetical protein